MTDGLDTGAAARLLIVHLAQRRIENARKLDQLIAVAAGIERELRQDFRRLMDLVRTGAPDLRDLEAERLRALAPWVDRRFSGPDDTAAPADHNGTGTPPDSGYDAHLPSVAEMLRLAGMPVADEEVMPLIAASQSLNWATVAARSGPSSGTVAAHAPAAVADDPSDVDGLRPVKTTALAPDVADDLAPIAPPAEELADADGLTPIKPTFFAAPALEPAAHEQREH